ncbi:MAG: hypothetical protein RBS72_16505 [Sedimentisphaerales bacterium]|jgi:hypothetical protein|nr:hypothetical protein [Sedimentisphaerales bacterium]HNY79263.1 hypothetical protein [Sedimentisphaerales bacterium]HOC61551.1 hypothetical protein [Sedimentisphaerales bacterium]HOH65185.1 hypothetical protein [Sedimentisphaerales bacterium]HPY49908.1 hypothetical protein [Sedimentisphaerales bacterium]
MLRVRIDNHDAKVMPISLAQMVFDGRLDRHDPAKSSDGATEQPLERAIGPTCLEALAAELLVRLRSMYRRGVRAEGIDALRTRVESLCQWHWAVPNIRARFLWSAAWLNELSERFETAVSYYDAFLQARCRESHLRLLAYNNRGALCIRLGRLDGVQDLAKSAIPSDTNSGRPAPVTGLPAACFNLLNVINVAIEVDNLTQAVDGQLTEYFLQLPEEARRHWLGAASHADRASMHGPEESSILGDPTWRSLNHLTSRLAAQAMSLDPIQAAEQTPAREPSCELLLWGDDLPVCAHDRYAEAATLLLGNQIPSSLLSQDHPGRRAEQSALEELAEIEGLVAAGSFELARSRLEVQRKILVALDHQVRRDELLAQVEAELLRIKDDEKDFRQLQLQRTCARLVSELERVCKLTNLTAAERQIEDLKHRLAEHKSRLGPQAGAEFVGLLEELSFRAERHLGRLRRLDVRKRIREPLRQLRRTWPADWTAPVPDSAYAALAQCHLNDPSGHVEDWPRLRDQLDAHQAQFRLRTALAQWSSEPALPEKVEALLADVLTLCPDSWHTIAPFFGLTGERPSATASGAATDMRTALEAAARHMLPAPPAGSEQRGQSHRRDLLNRAGSLVNRAFRELHGNPGRFARLWECLRSTLTPALADAPVEAIADISAIAGRCLDHWPARGSGLAGRSDPRNPVRLFLESCEKTRCLAMAERLLDSEPAKVQEASEHIGWALGMGLDANDQVRRAAACLYLAGRHDQDPPALQRQVLDGLDAWAEGLAEDAVRRITEQEIIGRIATIRTPLGSAPSDRQEI